MMLEEDHLQISWCSSSGLSTLPFLAGNNFTIKACVCYPCLQRLEKSNFQYRIAIFSIFNARCLCLLFILHICVFPSHNSFRLLELLPDKFIRSVPILKLCTIFFILNAKEIKQTLKYV